MDGGMRVLLVNPLGVALKHYTESLERLLVDCGASVASIALSEPSASGQTRQRWIYEYIKALREATRENPHVIVIQTWPTLGYWDYVASRVVLRGAYTLIVFHDPHPLVHAVGYGHLARWIASLRPVAATAIVHSKAASEVVRADASLGDVIDLPHPMFPPEKPDGHNRRGVVIRVLGQYKAARDVHGMTQLAAQGPSDWRYEVIGRGWPAIAGWKVTSRFVEENEFGALIRGSSAIVIPYSRFFQSGVAIRTLELGTPVVGPRSSSLAELLGAESDWLVDGDSWHQAVEAAIRAEPEEIYRVASSAYDRVLGQWRAWLESSQPVNR
jgi:hypothetical protein